jgi:hypothetical protein
VTVRMGCLRRKEPGGRLEPQATATQGDGVYGTSIEVYG